MAHFEELSAYVAIARAGSISRAAEQRGVAKSALSRRLSDLETRLGVQLISRTTRHMALTPVGETFLKRAERILDDLNDAEAEARSSDIKLSGKLRIAAPLSYGLARLKPVLSEFIRTQSDLEIEIDFSDRKVNLVEDGFDLALRIGTLADSSLIARKIGSVRHVAAAAPAFWDMHGRPGHPRDLERLDCLRYLNVQSSRSIPYQEAEGDRGTLNPPIRLLASNSDFLASLAIDGCGFLIEPHFVLEPYLEDGSLEAVLMNTSWSDMNIYLLYPPTRRISARARAFSNAIIAQLQSETDAALLEEG